MTNFDPKNSGFEPRLKIISACVSIRCFYRNFNDARHGVEICQLSLTCGHKIILSNIMVTRLQRVRKIDAFRFFGIKYLNCQAVLSNRGCSYRL